MNNTFRAFLIGLLGAGAAMAATSASALPQGWTDGLPAWTATASSCSVDESSAGKYEFFNGQFRYLGTNVSAGSGLVPVGTVAAAAIATGPVYQPITVRCNVTPMYDYVPAKVIPGTGPDGITIETAAGWKSVNWNALIVGYKDPDGLNANAQVSVSLKRMSRATLTESTVATFNSNTKAVLAQAEDVAQFNHAFDFQKNEYYVEINLLRKTADVATPVAYSVRLAEGSVQVVPQ